MLKKLREPVNSLTHWAGAILALAGLIALLIIGWGTPLKVVSLIIYGVSLILLFSASATYHMVQVKDKALEIFRKIDHAAIYCLIAGTYRPFCINAFTGFWKWGMLTIIWSLAIIGIVIKVFIIRSPRWLNAGIYVAMGWLCVGASGQLLAALPAWVLTWLIIGGVTYTLGAVVYSTKMFNFVPGVFGFHEVWHIFVLLAAAAHFVAVMGVWQPVTMHNFRQVIDDIAMQRTIGACFPVVFNICDGDEVNGAPGVSVVHALEEKKLIYTGADAYFYEITTSKITMKEAFDLAQVPTAKWEGITARDQDISGIFDRLGRPLIVKPAVSGGSMGLCVKNVVETEDELREQIEKIFDGYRGWHLSSGGIVVEQFVNGPEFTTMIVGASDQPRNCVVYTPVERVFHPSLPDKEKFLSFDRLWEIYEDETPMPGDENFYNYTRPSVSMIRKLKRISWDAYVSVGGKGYTRVDLRMDKHSGNIYVLEVNAQCGLSEEEDYTSIGAILRMSDKSFTQMVVEIINDAALRWMKKNRVRKLAKSYRAA